MVGKTDIADYKISLYLIKDVIRYEITEQLE